MFDNLVNEYNDAKRKLADKVQESIDKLFQEAFVEYPEIKVINWTQYTPYFNDGETCEFYVNEFNVSNSMDMNAWGEFEEDSEANPDLFIRDGYDYPLIKDIQEFAESDVGTEIFKDIFGDHQYITVTKDGITAEEYDHD